MSTTELLGAAQAPLTWQHLTTKGRKPLSKAEFGKLSGLMTSANGRLTLTVLFIYVGGLASGPILHKDENLQPVFSIFPVPDEYKVSFIQMMYCILKICHFAN